MSNLKETENTTMSRFQVQGKVKVINGSILSPQNAGLRLVLNVMNLVGKPESPLYNTFKPRWPKVSEQVRGAFTNKTGTYKFGFVENTAVQSDTWVLSMLCQDADLKTNLDGLNLCLKEVLKIAKSEKGSVHVSTLLTDAIPELQEAINKQLVANGISVSYYKE